MATTSHASTRNPDLSELMALSERQPNTKRADVAAARYGVAAPLLHADEVPPGSPEPWHLVAAVRPDTPHFRALRVLDALGETLAGIVIIAGGAIATALATLL